MGSNKKCKKSDCYIVKIEEKNGGMCSLYISFFKIELDPRSRGRKILKESSRGEFPATPFPRISRSPRSSSRNPRSSDLS